MKDTPEPKNLMISVCIPTFRRPSQLKRLLESLENQELPSYCTFEIVVVDNDINRSAMKVCKEFRQTSNLDLCYLVESEQNIALVRNLSITQAAGEWVAFIDDDEMVEPVWLSKLISTQMETGADAVLGPVLPVFSQSASKWIKMGKFLERPRQKTKSLITKDTRSGNVLIKKKLFETFQFDLDFGLTGGEDTELFQRILQSGAKFVWCDEAIVKEWVPQERCNVQWILRRGFNGGLVHTKIKLKQIKNGKVVSFVLLKSLGITLACVGLLPIVLIFGRIATVRLLRKIAVQIGHMYVLFGSRYQFYSQN